MAAFKSLDDLLWWLSQDVLDAYCDRRDLNSEAPDDNWHGCDGCKLEGCEDCPAEIIELARRLEWQRE